MSKQNSLLALFFSLYCLVYFIITSILYYISISLGYDGLGIPFFGGGDDGEFYAEQARNIATNQPAILTSIHALVLGYILKIFNSDSIFLMKGFNYIGNILLAFIALFILKKTVKVPHVFNVSAIIMLIFFICYPSYLINSSLSIYRDTWISVYYILSVFAFISLFIQKGKPSKLFNAIILILSMSLLGGYRSYALLSFIIGSCIFLLFHRNKKEVRSGNKVIFISLIGFAFIYTAFRTYTFPIVGMSLQDALMYRNTAIELFAGGSQLNISLNQPNFILFLINYSYSVLSNALGPFPWQISGLSMVLVFISEGIPFLLICFLLYKKRKSFSATDTLLVIHAIVWFMLIGITNDNIGTAARLRMVGWIPLLIVFAKYMGFYITNKKIK
ncbi:hypothetical protein BK139_13255 [Paenibacillus sp. FSL R5-0490]|uniref:hypothetical protein n=1 Tax=Paenibacillus sp. FSL R5-0490 TaxID=1920424 RepID=UPI00096E9D40|nr:hypothetical protein [Paenibacillus sp. FSL R5-0490]OMF59363.1 hypothetical protein BK139_13255 [Paenibacillus sp. FSL R5-0490]